METPRGTVYREIQGFTQPFIYVITIPCSIFCIYSGVSQLFFNAPIDNEPLPVWAAWLLILFGIGLSWLIFSIRLITDVRMDGLYIRFYPLHGSFRRFRYEDIEECRAVTYRPILEYGGWGIRYSSKGTAYNIRGNRGVQLTLSGGKSVLIGSQDPEKICESVHGVRPKS
ncbi:hypothetical protein JXO52_13010 [bacterium]|nr:hypothetical protein [bacterium]